MVSPPYLLCAGQSSFVSIHSACVRTGVLLSLLAVTSTGPILFPREALRLGCYDAPHRGQSRG